MNKNQITKEKTCAFYASDYHFEMITLPYIEKKLEEHKEIVILTENNLEDTIKTLMEKVNLKEEKKNNIFRINWKNDDLNKFKQIKEDIDKNKDIIILIKGKENYIKNINENIEKWINNNCNIRIIDCYDIGEVGDNLYNVMGMYKNILSTTGEKKIEK